MLSANAVTRKQISQTRIVNGPTNSNPIPKNDLKPKLGPKVELGLRNAYG